MADGTISADRADTIAAATGFLSDEDAAKADEILAAAAPGLRVDQLGRKAAALEMKLDPEAVRVRKEHAKSTRQRVEVRRELSGQRLHRRPRARHRQGPGLQGLHRRDRGQGSATTAGLEESLSSIRALVMTELLQGRDPLDLIQPRAPAAGAAAGRRPAPATGAAARRAPQTPRRRPR